MAGDVPLCGSVSTSAGFLLLIWLGALKTKLLFLKTLLPDPAVSGCGTTIASPSARVKRPLENLRQKGGGSLAHLIYLCVFPSPPRERGDEEEGEKKNGDKASKKAEKGFCEDAGH